MRQAFSTTFRKAQDATRNRLHRLAEVGQIRGFVLSYLGQRDNRLPWLPGDLPPRESVCGYPTDFSPMREEDLGRLARRGERLTRLLVAHYLPQL